MFDCRILLVAAAMLSASCAIAADTAITSGGLSLGRNFPGAQGSLKPDADGNLVLSYDFSKGGRYVGAEITLPAAGMTEYTLKFEPQQPGIRSSLVIMQPGNQIETKRRHYHAGPQEIVIDANTEFLKPGAEVDGSARKVMFRIEKSANAPVKGSVILKSIQSDAAGEADESAGSAGGAAGRHAITSGALSLGRNFPGAKGSLKPDANGNLVLSYDFSKGGRYVGAELALPAKGLDEFTINFEPQQRGIRASLVVMQPGNAIETKRRHYLTGDQQIVVNNEADFLKPGAEVDGTAGKVLFRIEKSANAPVKGSVILKSFETPAGEGTAEAAPAAAAGKKVNVTGTSSGREYPGARCSLKKDASGNPVFAYDFTNGGRYVGAEITLPAAGMQEYTISFEPKQSIRASLIIIQDDGRIETKRRHFRAGDDEIVVNADTQFLKPGAEVDGTARKVMFRIEKSANAPLKGSVVFKNISY